MGRGEVSCEPMSALGPVRWPAATKDQMAFRRAMAWELGSTFLWTASRRSVFSLMAWGEARIPSADATKARMAMDVVAELQQE